MKHAKIYAEHLEDTALEQFNSAMALDCVVKGALMPDAHTGYSLPIGAVVATKGKIFPSWVGYDIGCGMCALKTTFRLEDVKENAELIFQEIYNTIPVGFKVNGTDPEHTLDEGGLTPAGQEVFAKRKGFLGLGTLGGGNHFIEIGYDEYNCVWIVLHSGSRGVGHGMATHYVRIASGVNKVLEGHYSFDEDSEDGRDYINDMNWCLEYALENRKILMCRTVQSISAFCEGGAKVDGLINRNHNHAERKDGLWIHRKGATHAERGMMGVIPGNMRDGSFIVEGKGCVDALWSSSHGAGRVLGRKAAKRELNLTDFEDTMAGVVAMVGEDTLDEAPLAYKNIFEVMDLQKDLVRIVAHVKPVINIKG